MGIFLLELVILHDHSANAHVRTMRPDDKIVIVIYHDLGRKLSFLVQITGFSIFLIMSHITTYFVHNRIINILKYKEVSAMTLCTFPYGTYSCIVTFCEQCEDHDTRYSLLFLFFCNALLDPFLYAMTQRKILTFMVSENCVWNDNINIVVTNDAIYL